MVEEFGTNDIRGKGWGLRGGKNRVTTHECERKMWKGKAREIVRFIEGKGGGGEGV